MNDGSYQQVHNIMAFTTQGADLTQSSMKHLSLYQLEQRAEENSFSCLLCSSWHQRPCKQNHRIILSGRDPQDQVQP